MRLIALIFFFLLYSSFKVLVFQEAGTEIEAFPTFVSPGIQFIDLSQGCSGFFDCTEYVGAVIYDIALSFLFIALLIYEVVRYLTAVIAWTILLQLTGLGDAPPMVNLLFAAPPAIMLGIIIFKMLRKGDTSA